MLTNSSIMSRKRKGNPNWGVIKMPSSEQAKPTSFEVLLQDLGIPEEGCAKYPQIRTWVKKHAKLCYIPEELLKEC